MPLTREQKILIQDEQRLIDRLEPDFALCFWRQGIGSKYPNGLGFDYALDASGNMINPSQSTGTVQPTWNSTKKAMSFDGADYLERASTTFTGGHFYVIGVYESLSGSDSLNILFTLNFGSGNGIILMRANTNTEDMLSGDIALLGNGTASANNPRAIGPNPLTGPSPVGFIGRLGTGIASFRTLGIERATRVSIGASVPSIGSNTLYIGSNAGSNFVTGYIRSLIIGHTLIEGNLLNQVENYIERLANI